MYRAATVLLVISSTLLPGIFAQKKCYDGPSRNHFAPVLYNNRVYIAGGSVTTLDIYSLDLSQGLDINCPVWTYPTNLQTNNQYKPFQNAVAFPGGQGLYIQTDDGSGSVGGSSVMAQLVTYNVTGSWSTVSKTGDAPLVRSSMTATVNASGTAFYYGGKHDQSSTSQYYSDFYTFDTPTSSWNWPPIKYGWGKPPSRYGHTGTLVGDKLFIIGGRMAEQVYADFRSALIFDTVQNKAMSMATIGDIPPARYDFTAVPAPDGKSIVVFGGQNISSTFTLDSNSDVYLLDTCTLSWSKVSVGGTAPAARAGHGAVVYGKYMLVMLGYTQTFPVASANDVAILDMEAWKWVDEISTQDTSSTSPTNAGCTFTFPPFPTEQVSSGDAPMPYDPTVVTNPNKTGNGALTKGLAISLSLLSVLLIVGCLYHYRRRQRQRRARALNPRWLPGAITSHKGNSSEYPLFVYQNLDGSDEKLKDSKDSIRSYTATDHDQWERSLVVDKERPEDGRAMSRHLDVWERMRNLKSRQENSIDTRAVPMQEQKQTGLSLI